MRNGLYSLLLISMITPMLSWAQQTPPNRLETDPLRRRLESITISKMAFVDTRASIIFEFLQVRSKKVDPNGYGVEFIVKLRPKNQPAKAFIEPTVSLDVDKLPLYDIIRYVCLHANLRYKKENGKVVILGPDVEEDNFERRSFNVPAYFVDGWQSSIGTRTLQQYFQEMGVAFRKITFSNGVVRTASLTYDRGTGTLEAYNLPEQNERLRTILQHIVLGKKPEIETPLERKLREIVITKISFHDTRVSTVFEFLKNRSRALDPDSSAMNFLPVLHPSPGMAIKEAPLPKDDGDIWDDDDDFGYDDDLDPLTIDEEDFPREPTITMDFDNIPLGLAIRYICEQCNLSYTIERGAVVILGPDADAPTTLRFYPLKSQVVDGITASGKRSLKSTLQLVGLRLPTFSSGEKAALAYDRRSELIVSFNSHSQQLELASIIQRLTDPPKTLYENPLDDKLDSIVLKNVQFNDATISSVFTFLKEQSRLLDREDIGINFMLMLSFGSLGFDGDEENGFFVDDNPESFKEPRVTVNMRNATVRNVIDALCDKAGLIYFVEQDAVVIRKSGVEGFGFETAFFPVDLKLFNDRSPHIFFEQKGVTFPGNFYNEKGSKFLGDEACIIVDAHNSQILVRNSTENVRKMRTILRKLRK